MLVAILCVMVAVSVLVNVWVLRERVVLRGRVEAADMRAYWVEERLRRASEEWEAQKAAAMTGTDKLRKELESAEALRKTTEKTVDSLKDFLADAERELALAMRKGERVYEDLAKHLEEGRREFRASCQVSDDFWD